MGLVRLDRPREQEVEVRRFGNGYDKVGVTERVEQVDRSRLSRKILDNSY